VGRAGEELTSSSGRPYFGPANRAAFRVLRTSLRAVFLPYFRLKLIGAERLPAGPFVIAPNHASLLDPVVLQLAVPRRLVYMMTEEWYDVAMLKRFFRFVRAIRVRENAGSNRGALAQAALALLNGIPVGIFPEGRLARDGRLGKFHPGVTLLAMRVGVPIVPAAIQGTAAAMPPDRRIPKPRRITIRLGEPMDVHAPPDMTARARRALAEQMAEKLRSRVAELLAADA
jgi:1-acyl-sn-glycerol-3-phosphate acyltransferase